MSYHNMTGTVERQNKVLLIYTGGTIGMGRNPKTGALEPLDFQQLSMQVPEFDDEYFKSHCDSLRMSVASNQVRPLADSVMYSYAAYMLTSLELEDVLLSDFIDTRSWYFERLQPRFDRLRGDLDQLSRSIYKDLEKNSATFERGFYRSVIPGIVAVGVGLLLVLMLLFFLLAFYVNPLYRMLDGLNA